MMKSIIFTTFIFTLIQARSITQDEVQLMEEKVKSWKGNDKVDLVPKQTNNETAPRPATARFDRITTTTTPLAPTTNSTLLPSNASARSGSPTVASTKPVKVVLDCTRFCRRRKRNNTYRKGPCSRMFRPELCLICRYVFFCGRSTKYF